MAASDTLLQLITRLQRNISVADGRRLLLDYVRKSSGARLVLLFLLDKENQVLMLLERSGRCPEHQHIAPDQSTPPWPPQGVPLQVSSAQEPPDPGILPLHGLFGSVLQRAGLVRIPDVYANPLSLPGELHWCWRGGPVLLSPVGRDPKGVLVLCFGPGEQEGSERFLHTPTNERDLLVCTALLSAYLSPLPDASQTQTEQKAAIEQERNRIARDIHDGPAQQIAHGLHKLEFVQRLLERQSDPPQLALREIIRVRNLLEESLNDLRYGILSPIPTQLQEQGLASALTTLLEYYALNEPGLQISYSIDQLHHIPSSLEVPIFRLIQEALNNVRKHAKASHVTIRIRSHSGFLQIEVNDNGRGFQIEDILRGAHSAHSTSHFGLLSMRERVQQVGGTLKVQSKPGAGTTIKARFPLTSPTTGILTNREREVLRLLAEGATNRAIAEELSVSIETVKSHVHHIMQKMQVKDRTQAAVLATRQQWL